MTSSTWTSCREGWTGLALNTFYTVTAVGGSSGAWTFTITTPTTGGTYSSPPAGGATILTIPYGPVCVFPSGGQAQAAQTSTTQGQLYMYPNPADRTTYGVFAMMVTGQSVAGQTLVHQSRIICLAGVNYDYPAGSGFATNENLNFTDPPLSASFGNQQTVLAAEEPYGYGGGGSISAGELFLVKKRGGGIIVTGDVISPQVTILPGVTSTGNFYGQGASTPAGFVYASEDNGMWAWNGSNTSQKISANLDDAFFLPPEFATMASNNYGYYAQEYGNRIYTSNNWMLDLQFNAWWTYFPRKSAGTVGGIAGQDLFWVQPVNGNYIYAAQLSFIGATSLNFMYRFDPATPTQYYQWQSLPIYFGDQDHRTDIREVIVRASCHTSGCSIALTVADQQSIVWGPVTNSATLGAGPQMLRWNVGATELTQPAIRIAVTGAGSGDMPVIHSIDIRYKTVAHQVSGD